MPAVDIVPERGPWMQTCTGHKFFPGDPRPEEVQLQVIAHGLAAQRRYGGQGHLDKHYSVAEHSVHIARHMFHNGYPPKHALVGLLHDAAEAYVMDLPVAAKDAVGDAYRMVERNVQAAIWARFGLEKVALAARHDVKLLDKRIVPTEKAAVLCHPTLHRWVYEELEPLPVTIGFWAPVQAYQRFLGWYQALTWAYVSPPTEDNIND